MKRQDVAYPKKGSVGEVAVKAILAGKSTAQVIAAVRRKFPKAKASGKPSGVAWYRAELKRRGVKLPKQKKEAGR